MKFRSKIEIPTEPDSEIEPARKAEVVASLHESKKYVDKAVDKLNQRIDEFDAIDWAPDYANMETVNRWASSDTWTAGRDGYIYGKAAQSYPGYSAMILVNGKEVSLSVSAANGHTVSAFRPVKAGDVISYLLINGAAWNEVTPECYYCPPKGPMPPSAIPNYSAMQAINRWNGVNSWECTLDGFVYAKASCNQSGQHITIYVDGKAVATSVVAANGHTASAFIPVRFGNVISFARTGAQYGGVASECYFCPAMAVTAIYIETPEFRVLEETGGYRLEVTYPSTGATGWKTLFVFPKAAIQGQKTDLWDDSRAWDDSRIWDDGDTDAPLTGAWNDGRAWNDNNIWEG